MGTEPEVEAYWVHRNIFTNPIVSYPEGLTLKEVVGSDVLTFLAPHWLDKPPMSPLFSYAFAVIFFITGILSLIGNGMVLYVFAKFETLRRPANVLIMNLAFCDLMLMLTLVPEATYGYVHGSTWIFGYSLCIFHSFCGALFGYGQITTLVFIAYDRYTVIAKGFAAKALTFGKVKTLLICIWLWSLFWAVTPLVGFGSYSIDGSISTCSFDYTNRDPTNVKYILAVVIFTYFIPLFLITFYYYNIVKAVWSHEAILRDQAKKMNVASFQNNVDTDKTSAEIRIARISMINIALWLIAWTPFTIVSIIGVVGNRDVITPVVSGMPIIAAKSSCIYNPIIYAISHPRYRLCLKKLFPHLCCFIKELPKIDNQSTVTATEITKISDAKE